METTKTKSPAIETEEDVVNLTMIVAFVFIGMGIYQAGFVGHTINFVHGMISIGLGVGLLIFLRLAYLFGRR